VRSFDSEHRDREERHKIYGVVIGIVTNIVHDKGQYMVKVKFPFLADSDESDWCRVLSLGAGGNSNDGKHARGLLLLPEVEDEVLVAFEHGDIARPYVLGSLFNGKDKPGFVNKDGAVPAADKMKIYIGSTEAKKNDIRAFHSRVMHGLVFNDNAKDPKVSLYSSQKHRIVLDDKGNEPVKIEIFDGKEENYILIDTKNKKITIESKTGDLLIKAKEKIMLEAKTIETKSSADTNMKADGNFKMETSGNMTLKANGQGEVNSSGTLTVKGSTVNIN